MKYVESLNFFKKRKKEEFKGKKETYRFDNIYDDEKGIRRGNCKGCGGKEVDITEHSNSCDKLL